jgi:hypothetical protein
MEVDHPEKNVVMTSSEGKKQGPCDDSKAIRAQFQLLPDVLRLLQGVAMTSTAASEGKLVRRQELADGVEALETRLQRCERLLGELPCARMSTTQMKTQIRHLEAQLTATSASNSIYKGAS